MNSVNFPILRAISRRARLIEGHLTDSWVCTPTMCADQPPDEWDAEQYRAYLRFLAGTLVDLRLQSKVDLSGIVQQTLLDVHLSRGKQQVGSARPPLAWFRKILADNLTDELRRLGAAKRSRHTEVSLDAALDASSQRLEAWIVANDPTPGHQASTDEQLLAMVAALEQLPEAQRQAIVLQFWHGCSVAEIAERLGKTRLAVAGLLKRGLQHLRTITPR